MGNIIDDVVDEMEVKPNRNKLILKWVVSISISLISIAFLIGQYKSGITNRIGIVETKTDNNLKLINQHKSFDNWRFYEYQKHNDKQLMFIINYGINDDNVNKDLIRETIELNSSHLMNNLNEEEKK